MRTTDVYRKAVEYWGEQFQMDMMIEECCELIHAIMKYRRKKATILDVAEECADVIIMLGQMEVIIQEKDFRIPSLVSIIKEEKLKRLEGIVCKEEEP